MRRAAKVDTVQAEIVQALRAAGAVVQSLASLGQGCPDLLVGYQHRNVLLEVKSRGGRLTPMERQWHEGWRGQVVTVWTVEQALYAIGACAVSERKGGA